MVGFVQKTWQIEVMAGALNCLPEVEGRSLISRDTVYFGLRSQRTQVGSDQKASFLRISFHDLPDITTQASEGEKKAPNSPTQL